MPLAPSSYRNRIRASGARYYVQDCDFLPLPRSTRRLILRAYRPSGPRTSSERRALRAYARWLRNPSSSPAPRHRPPLQLRDLSTPAEKAASASRIAALRRGVHPSLILTA